MKDLDKNVRKVKNGSYLLMAPSAVWECDTTYHIGGKRVERQPNLWKLNVDILRIKITKFPTYGEGTWIMYCRQLRLIEVKCVNCNTATEAAEYAVNLVNKKLGEMTNAIKNLQKR